MEQLSVAARPAGSVVCDQQNRNPDNDCIEGSTPELKAVAAG
jgi:hypothetical protein